MELQLCLDTLIAHFRLYLVVLVLGSFRCLCARSAGGRILRSDWQSRWIEFVDGVSGDLAGFILQDSAPEQGLMRCLARCSGAVLDASGGVSREMTARRSSGDMCWLLA